MTLSKVFRLRSKAICYCLWTTSIVAHIASDQDLKQDLELRPSVKQTSRTCFQKCWRQVGMPTARGTAPRVCTRAGYFLEAMGMGEEETLRLLHADHLLFRRSTGQSPTPRHVVVTHVWIGCVFVVSQHFLFSCSSSRLIRSWWLPDKFSCP